jgi:formate dehydrogenase major subunit
MHHLTKRVMAHYAGSQDPKDWPVVNLHWPYAEHGPTREPHAEDVLREINGYVVAGGEPVPRYDDLEADGSTACGCWIYSGIYADGVNQARRRDPGDLEAEGGWVSPEWGWAWPANRRILYNRASADPEGRPWSERKKYVWWDAEQRRWTGYDVPDFPLTKPPDYRAPEDGGEGMAAICGDEPFIMMGDGRGWLFSPSGLLDGPLPTHYEPVESPFANMLYPNVGANPATIRWERPDNPVNATGDPRWPCVLTTFRLTEHHTVGGMSRDLPWLNELQPEMFAELDPTLAAARGIEDGGWLVVSTERGEIEARAVVTERMRPLRVGGRIVHQVALPWHWGYSGLNTGDSANDLLHLSADPNVNIETTKALTCDVRAGRRSTPATSRVTNAPRGHVAPDQDHPAERTGGAAT